MADIAKFQLAKRLRALRASRGLTQVELSQKLAEIGVKYSQARISRLERRWGKPSPEVMSGLAQVLGTSVAYLQMATNDVSSQPSTETPLSAEAEAAARLIDDLPEDSRATLLSALKALADSDDAVDTDIVD